MRKIFFAVVLFLLAGQTEAADTQKIAGMICAAGNLDMAMSIYDQPAQPYLKRIAMLYNDKTLDPVIRIQGIGNATLNYGLKTWEMRVASSTCPVPNSQMVQIVSPLLNILSGMAITAGFMMGVIVPMLPMVWWVLALFVWFVRVLGHVSGSTLLSADMLMGSEKTLDKVMRSLLELVFAPPLMVLGFISANFVLRAGFWVLQWQAESTILAFEPSFHGIVRLIGLLFIMACIALYMVRKVYGLTLILPDKVLDFAFPRIFRLEENMGEGDILGLPSDAPRPDISEDITNPTRNIRR
jgi:conjugal transfer/type IV secretion protein DotA/TraY